MNIIYNNQSIFASNISNFLLKCNNNIRKTQLNIIPYIILGMILSESSVSSDIAKELKDDFSLVKFDSIIKRIKRLFNNKLFNPYSFYDSIIKFVIKSYKKKHSDKRVHIVFDHMFSHDNFTIFMISMRIGKQGIPLWFRCFKGKDNSDAFKLTVITEGINYVSNLFGNNFDLIFLADRWFNSTKLMDYINSLGHTYCLRLKGNYKVTYFDNLKKHNVETYTQNLSGQKFKCKYYKNISYTENNYKTNIVISDDIGSNHTPWIIATNGDPRRAVKDYSYRFGGIECMFKSQKSNGFYIKSTVNCSIKYFTSMYSFVCFCTLFLNLFGADYTKNSKCYKDVKLTIHKNFKTGKKRVMSLFNIGLTLFKRSFNSSKYIRVPYSFILYDI